MNLFEELRELLGPDATVKLLARYGGRRLYVPMKIKDNHRLNWWLGDKAHLLSDRFGGCSLDLPLARKEISRLRRQRIIELRRNGASIRQIIATLGCSRRWAQTVLAEAKAEGRLRRAGNE